MTEIWNLKAKVLELSSASAVTQRVRLMLPRGSATTAVLSQRQLLHAQNQNTDLRGSPAWE